MGSQAGAHAANSQPNKRLVASVEVCCCRYQLPSAATDDRPFTRRGDVRRRGGMRTIDPLLPDPGAANPSMPLGSSVPRSLSISSRTGSTANILLRGDGIWERSSAIFYQSFAQTWEEV